MARSVLFFNGFTIPPNKHMVTDIIGHPCFEVLRLETKNGEPKLGVAAEWMIMCSHEIPSAPRWMNAPMKTIL